MTLGCGAVAGNITSDNVGPQHLINIKRLAYVVRKPEEAFEMPLDYNAAPNAPARRRWWDRSIANAVVAAVERYLASRGIAVAASARRLDGCGPSCGCSHSAAGVAVGGQRMWRPSVVDQFLAGSRARAGSADWPRQCASTPPRRRRPPPPQPPPKAGGVRLRSRRARRDPGESQNLYRAEDDRHAFRPRPGRSL